jgi:hypothetical protein
MTDSRFHRIVAGALARHGCPDAFELGEFSQTVLPAEVQLRVQSHLDACAACQNDLRALRAFVEQNEPGWEVVREWAVQVWRDAGQVVRVALRPFAGVAWLPPALLPATRGAAPGENDAVLRYLSLGVDALDNMAIEARVLATTPDLCDIVVRVEVPSRWPELAGTRVSASADDWHRHGVTDADGQVRFGGLSRSKIESLIITARHADSEADAD